MTVAALSPTGRRSYKVLPLQGKRVLVRVDFNVPLDKDRKVTDDSRLRASLPTLDYLLGKKAKIILISHLGRPKGQVNPRFSLKPVVEPLSELLHVPVRFVEDCVGPCAYEAVAKLKPGGIVLLENLRFHDEEEKNNSVFAKELASLADFFIQDAFGSVHRAHASTSRITKHIQSAAGPLLEKELKFLTQMRSHSARPYLAILGGAKVSDKIGVVRSFLGKVDSLFIGGAMAYTFLKAQGVEVGDSLCEEASLAFCKDVLAQAEDKNVPVTLPQDHLIAQDIRKPEGVRTTDGASIPRGWKGVDIGPKTLTSLRATIENSKTIFWNGPAGIFEIPAYSEGTLHLAHAMAHATQKGSTVVVGGGDSAAAVKKAGVHDKMSYVSTGGGASLEFLEGKELPGVTSLPAE